MPQSFKSVVQQLVCGIMVLYVTINLGISWIVRWFMFFSPSMKAKIARQSSSSAHMPPAYGPGGAGSSIEHWQDSLVTMRSWRAVRRSILLDMRKSVYAGGPAHNSRMFALDGSSCRLLDFQKGSRPLVVAFGSCTWPPFIASFDQLRRLAERSASIADFLVIYIEEAHPSDGWALGNNYAVKTHRTLAERIEAARILLTETSASIRADVGENLTLVVDSIDDEANRAYGGLFERLYVIRDGVVAYQGARGPSGYRLGEVEDWLDKYSASVGVGRDDGGAGASVRRRNLWDS